MDDIASIFDYHDQTKHHFQRYARSLGYLDWANQPEPFRHYRGAHQIRLPLDLAPEPLPYRRLFEPAAVAAQEVNLKSLSLFFRYSLALSAWKQSGENRWALRVNPSSGNLHPTEGYLLHESVDGRGEPTLYHYTADQHALERRAVIDRQAWTAIAGRLPAGSFLLGLTSILWRESWKYGERGFRYCQHDLGHALAAARLSAALLGWQLRPLIEWSTADIASLLGTDRREDFPEEEHEEAELLAVVAPNNQSFSATDLCPPPSDATLAAIRNSHWFGKANRLSTDYVRWPLIDAAAAASRKPRGALVDETAEKHHERPALAGPASDVEAHSIILQRRSALDMDGSSSTTLDIFLSMLATGHARQPPTVGHDRLVAQNPLGDFRASRRRNGARALLPGA